MKKLDSLLDKLYILLTIIFFAATAIMVLGQLICIVTLNGAQSVMLVTLIAKRASAVSAVATGVALILAYLRGQMKAQDD